MLEGLRPISGIAFFVLTLPLPLKDFVSSICAYWSAAFPDDLNSSITTVFEEISNSLDNSLFSAGNDLEGTSGKTSKGKGKTKKSDPDMKRGFEEAEEDEIGVGEEMNDRWQDLLQGNFDEQKDRVALISSHLAHLHSMTRFNYRNRSKLTGVRSRFKLAESLFNDQQFRDSFKRLQNAFSLDKEFSPIKDDEQIGVSYLDDDYDDNEDQKEEERGGEKSHFQKENFLSSKNPLKRKQQEEEEEEEGEIEEDGGTQDPSENKRRKIFYPADEEEEELYRTD